MELSSTTNRYWPSTGKLSSNMPSDAEQAFKFSCPSTRTEILPTPACVLCLRTCPLTLTLLVVRLPLELGSASRDSTASRLGAETSGDSDLISSMDSRRGIGDPFVTASGLVIWTNSAIEITTRTKVLILPSI